jgi:carboxylesterase type B
MTLEDKVNKILGLEPAKTPTEKKEFQPPVPRTEDKNAIKLGHKQYLTSLEA